MGLLHLVEYLNLTDAVRTNPSMVKLVFVTPQQDRGEIQAPRDCHGTDFSTEPMLISPGWSATRLLELDPRRKRSCKKKGSIR